MDTETKQYIEARLDRLDEKVDIINDRAGQILIRITRLNGAVMEHEKRITELPCESRYDQFLDLSREVAELIGAERVTGKRNTEERRVSRSTQAESRQVARTTAQITFAWIWELAKIVLPLSAYVGFGLYLIKQVSSP